MRLYLTISLLLISLTCAYAEIVGVPLYDYSVYPLEGWKLQEYEDASTLSWLSDDNAVAFTVTSWSGETFSDVKTMFADVTKGFNAAGDCVPFEYLQQEAVIGEITFPIGDKNHKGWLLLINGEKFDYYLLGFTLEVSYVDNYSEIQSAIDSFSMGSEGALSPGPITTFLNASPNKTEKSFEVDFFNNPLNVNASISEFETAQTVIEREANIMLNYSNDPAGFYNAWTRYYEIIFRDNYTRLDPLYAALKPYFGGDKYTDYELTELLMFWIQGYTYEREPTKESDLLNPLEASLKKTGDCDARSLVLGILLHKFSIESVLLTSEKVQHALLAVNCEGDGATYNFEGKEFLTVELTSQSLIGEIKKSMADPKLWTPISMGYSNGY